MKRLMAAMMFAALATASAAQAQYSVGALYNKLTLGPTDDNPCTRTWYDPELYTMPNGDLRFIAQGGAPNACMSQPWDSIFGATRASAGGAWTTPGYSYTTHQTDCPTLFGQYTRCNYNSNNSIGAPISSPSVIRLPNSNSASGWRYFMAFPGGNADYIEGRIYWAYSDDGQSWTVYNWNATEVWKAIITAKYTRNASQPSSDYSCAAPSGFGQLQIAYENGLIYIYGMYYHSNGSLSPLIYRFDYSSAHPFGFGPSVRQIYFLGSWQSHSGNLVWNYDKDVNGNQLPVDSFNGVADPVLVPNGSLDSTGYGFGAGDLKYGNGKWVHVRAFGPHVYVQTATSLTDPTTGNASSWSAESIIDYTNVRNAYPATNEGFSPGLWYGNLGTGNHWWIFIPVNWENPLCGDGGGAEGNAIVPAILCTPDAPC